MSLYKLFYLHCNNNNMKHLKKIEKKALCLIFFLSLAATLWSLYYGAYWDPFKNIVSWSLFDAFNGFAPCTLCWYMRVFQYPLVLLSWIGLYTHDKHVARRYILPMAIIWLVISTYKWFVEEWWIIEQGICTPDSVSCGIKYVDYFWFLTLPLMWVLTFVAIILCCLVFKKEK